MKLGLYFVTLNSPTRIKININVVKMLLDFLNSFQVCHCLTLKETVVNPATLVSGFDDLRNETQWCYKSLTHK